MKVIDYASPRTLEEAVRLLAGSDRLAHILAGGTDVIVQVREGRRDLDLLVDVKRIPELSELTFDVQRGLVIGAAVPCCVVCEHEGVAASYPGLIDAASLVGGTAIQSRATLGGNLCNASPAADTVPALIAHSAVCHVAGPDGRRSLAVEEFCTAPGRTVLQPGEMLVSLEVPAAAECSGACYERFIPRNEMDIAVVGVGAMVTLDGTGTKFVSGRLSLGAVAPTPLLVDGVEALLAGAEVCEKTIDRVAETAQEAARPISDMRGTARQRRHLVGVLTRRVLRRAIDRAGSRK